MPKSKATGLHFHQNELQKIVKISTKSKAIALHFALKLKFHKSAKILPKSKAIGLHISPKFEVQINAKISPKSKAIGLHISPKFEDQKVPDFYQKVRL